MGAMETSSAIGTEHEATFAITPEMCTARFLTFAVTAQVGERLLGEGTHKRAMIDLTRRR